MPFDRATLESLGFDEIASRLAALCLLPVDVARLTGITVTAQRYCNLCKII
jgi:hypothetical protein